MSPLETTVPVVSHPVVQPSASDESLETFLDILKPLIREPSVVGNEDAFFRVLRRELEEIGVRVNYYHGVLVAQGDRPHDLFFICPY